MNGKMSRLGFALAAVAVVILAGADQSFAVPSYARQTNLPCSACHVLFPELNQFGRLFKLHGYTMVGTETIEVGGDSERPKLNLLKIPPLSGMLEASFNRVDKRLAGTQNNNVQFPEQLSFFFSGQVAPHFGAFVQFTYAVGGQSFSWDLVDIRFASETQLAKQDLIYGATLNNNPTIQDVWNSTPVWGFPYATSSVAPSPSAATLIDGGLEREVAGLGAYALWNNMIYGELDVYRSSPQEGPHPPDQTSSHIISNLAPYWRAVWQHQTAEQYLSIGTYGLSAKVFPTGISGQVDKFNDIAFDLQAEKKISEGTFTAHATWIGESQKLNATYAAGLSERASLKLNTVRANLNYYLTKPFGVLLGYFSTFGDRDTVLYSPAPIVGSRIGKPNSDGFVAELDFIPWLNTKFSIQYVLYGKFNGARNNYDGSGRNASDNNTLFLLTWFAM